jgi:dienelactone hydrolase
VASYDDLAALYDYDVAAPLDIQEAGIEDRAGIAVHDISFASPIEGRVTAYLVAPPGEGPFAGALYVHWLGGSTSNRGQYLEEALQLAGSGTVVLLVNAAWAGPTQFWERDIELDSAASIKQVVDLRRAIDVLAAQPGVDPERLAYVGHDFGAMYGALLAGVDPRLKAYVLIAGIPTLTDWFLLGYVRLDEAERAQYIEALAKFAPLYYINHAAPAELFFQFAEHDTYVSAENRQAFFEAASEPKRMELYKGGHQMIGDQDDLDRLEFLRDQLGLAAS